MFKNLSTLALGFSCPQYEQIELALSCGFSGMSLNAADFARQIEMRGLEKARRLITSARIKLGTYVLPVAINGSEELYQQELKALPARSQAALEIDCTRAILNLAPASDELPMHENFELHRKRLAPVAADLASKGQRLALGFQGLARLRRDKSFEFIHQLDSCLKLVEVLGPNVGLNLNLWDLAASGGSIEDLRRIPRERIVAIEVADAPADKPIEEWETSDRLLPGEGGAIDLAQAFRILSEMEFDGPVTPACPLKRFAGLRRDVQVKRVGDALDKAWREADLTSEHPLQAVLSKN